MRPPGEMSDDRGRPMGGGGLGEDGRPLPEPEAAAEDEAAQMAVLEEMAVKLWRRGLAGPAVFVLETMRPVTFITAEFMVFLEPFAGAVLPVERYRLLAEALHDRRKVAWLADRLEELDAAGGPAGAPPADAEPEGPPGAAPSPSSQVVEGTDERPQP
jgi:hypothetical protein